VQELPQGICTQDGGSRPNTAPLIPKAAGINVKSTRKHEPKRSQTEKWACVFFFLCFKYSFSVPWVFLILLSAIFVKDNIFALYLTQSFQFF